MEQQEKKVKLGVSSCLLGEKVRYNGEDKSNPFLVEQLREVAELIPVCPEVGAGFGVPREPVRLVRLAGSAAPRMVTERGGIDLTPRITAWIDEQLEELEKKKLDGFIFKCKSPSCAVKQLPVYDNSGEIAAQGAGLFAAAFMKRFPGLPVVEERDLQDKKAVKDFMPGAGDADDAGKCQ
jgi:uncharacterized protein YbbK (DUF523 family)